MLPLLLVTALAPQSPLAVRTIQPEQGPTVLVHRQETPLAALRLSTPVPVELPEGSPELLQELARPEAEAAARRYGARLELRHDDGRAVLMVTGPAAAFDGLVAILRRATDEPDLSVASLRRARARVEDRVLARLEQPAPRVRRLLRHALYDGPEPAGAAATLLGPEAIRRVRALLYDPARIQITVVGPMSPEVIRSAFTGWPRRGSLAGASALRADTVPAARPQAHRQWAGVAGRIEGDPAVIAVAAELIRDRADASALSYGAVEVWYQPSAALALIGAAAPGDSGVDTATAALDVAPPEEADTGANGMDRYLRRLIAETTALAGPEAVAAARNRIRRRLLLDARTTAGKAEVIGQAAEVLGPEVGPEAFLDRLEVVVLADVRRCLDEFLAAPMATAGTR